MEAAVTGNNSGFVNFHCTIATFSIILCRFIITKRQNTMWAQYKHQNQSTITVKIG